MQSLRDNLKAEIAFARVNLGMSREEFMRQTPEEWEEAVKAWQAKEERENRRFARICMVLAWSAGNTEATEMDFVPQLPGTGQQTPEEIEAILDSYG